MRGARSAQSRLASPSSESQHSSSKARTQLTAFSQISAHASGAWRHPNTLVSIPIWDFYFDISEWHILSARTWTPALMLHLTNPCAKQKVLSLTKPKGKIYKTKSLGNYITLQRDTLAPFLFLVCQDYTLWISIDLKKKKVRSRLYPAETIIDVDYADNLALLKIHLLKPNLSCIAWINQQEALASIWTQIKKLCFNQDGGLFSLNHKLL